MEGRVNGGPREWRARWADSRRGMRALGRPSDSDKECDKGVRPAPGRRAGGPGAYGDGLACCRP